MQMTDWGGGVQHRKASLTDTGSHHICKGHMDEAHELTWKDTQRAVCLELPPPPPFLSPVRH